MVSMETLQAEVTALKKQQANSQPPTTTDQRSVQEEPNEGGSAVPQPVGSAASLRSDTALQEAVKLRLQALGVEDEDSTADEDDDASRGAAARRKPQKSGRKPTAANRVKVPVEWPHYHTYRGPGKDMAAYDDLTVTELVHGFVTTLLAGRPDAGNQAIPLRHLQHLMLDAADFGWEAARHAHGVVLQEMEAGRLTWNDEDAIGDIRSLYCQRFARFAPTVDTGAPTVTKGPLYCVSFQEGKCSHSTDHNTARGPVRHICAYCLRVQGCALKHSESACHRKAKNGVNTQSASG